MTELNKQQWGSTPEGELVELYTLRSDGGIEATITNYGGRLVTLKTPDRHDRFGDIVLGFDTLEGYLHKNPYFGALVGRYANRIANGRFSLNGRTYTLPRNNGTNSLHGGSKGFDKVVWGASETQRNGAPALELRYLSRDGEEGYPGNLEVTVTYSLSNDSLQIEYEATTDQDTVINLTNHSYFDLSGSQTGKILDYEVTINADRFTPVNANLIPTGELRKVEGTPFDFRQNAPIGSRINEKDQQLQYGVGYDHNFVLNRTGNDPTLAARAVDPESGRFIEVLTTQPGVQFYTGNHLDGSAMGKNGKVYGFRSGFCLETQHFPDSPNQPEFPSTKLIPNQRYRSMTIFRFGAV